MNLDRPTRCVRLLQTDSPQRVKIISGRSVDLHMERAELVNERVFLYDNVYLASFGRKDIKLRFDLFDASLVRRLAQQTILTYFSSTQIIVWFV